MAGEMLHDDFEFRVRLDAMQVEQRAIDAISDTWEFMTGSVMPDDVIPNARKAASERHSFSSV